MVVFHKNSSVKGLWRITGGTSQEEELANKAMNSCRISVEWSFKDVCTKPKVCSILEE